MSYVRFGHIGAPWIVASAIALSALALALIWLADLAFSFKIFTTGVVAVNYFATRLAVAASAREQSFAGIASVLSLYVCFAYSLKFGLLLHFYELSWLAQFPNFTSVSNEELAVAFCLSGIGTVFLSLGTAFPQLLATRTQACHRVNFGKMPISRMKILLASAWFMVVIKAIVQRFYNIGLPGVIPDQLPVPYLTGILAIAIGSCLILITNASFFFAMIMRERILVFLSATTVFANIFLDMSAGYKSSLIMEVVILSFYVPRFLEGKSRSTVYFTYIAFLGCGLVTIFLFPYINYYRFAILGGEQGASAVDAAMYYVSTRESSSLVELVNRINGLDNFFGALGLARGMRYPIEYIFDSGLNREFLGFVLGRDDLLTAFGLTQFGALYVVGGPTLLLAGSLLLGLLIRLISRILLRGSIRFEGGFTAVAPVIAAFWLKFLFASGDILLLGKELLLIWITVILLFSPVGVIRKSPLAAGPTRPSRTFLATPTNR